MKLLQSLCILAITLLFVSCGGDGGLELTLTSPGDGSTFTGGDTIFVQGIATDDVAVSNLIISGEGLINPRTLPGNGTSSLSFDFGIIVEVGTPSIETEIVVDALDAEGNTVNESRSITIQ